MSKNYILLCVFSFLVMNSLTLSASNPSENMNETEKEMKEEKTEDHLLIVWTSGDPEVALKMVFMYAYNAQKNGWWDQVSLLIWGPSEKLSAENVEIQEYLAKMKEAGVKLIACKACADMYGVCPKLEDMQVDVRYTGTFLTDYIKSGKKIVSF
jgi:hypothetical protein